MKKIWPKISLVTPSLNQGQFIEETILSVLNQNYPNLEYIVMDGGSTDGTLEILKKYSNRLKWYSAPDKGQADALNSGFKLATGEILGFINSDDYYLPGTLNFVAELFGSHSSDQIISGDYVIINDQGKEIEPWVRSWKNFLRSHHSRNTLAVANYLNQPSTFWRRSIYKKVGQFNQKLHFTFDYEYWQRIMAGGLTIRLVAKKLAAYRVHPGSKGGGDYKARSREELQVQQRFNSKPLLTLSHWLHNQIMIFAYDLVSLGVFGKLR